MTRTERDAQLRSLIKSFTAPELWRVCDTLTQGEDLAFLDTMRSVCRAFPNGAGLAAPQIGVNKRAVFIYPARHQKRGYFMLNPVLLESSHLISSTEGCLSFPGYKASIPRAELVKVRYFTETWAEKVETVGGFEAIVIQHEMDHLDGICHVGQAWKESLKPFTQPLDA